MGSVLGLGGKKEVTVLANNRQHGGSHYIKLVYQHWDFVSDCGLHYMLGCATKYVSRWRDKGGVEDLKKAVHYVDKAIEKGVVSRGVPLSKLEKFTDQLGHYEAIVIKNMVLGNYEVAKDQIVALIARAAEAKSDQPIA